MEEKSRIIHITIRNTANDQTYKLKVPGKINADTVLQQLRSRVRIPETYVLSFGGNVIDGDTPLEDGGIGEGDLLKLIPNPEGGGNQKHSPTLPRGLWESRLRYEYDALTEISRKEPVSFMANNEMTDYIITFNGMGLVRDDEGNITEHHEHTIEVNLHRRFPYAGGLWVRWVSPENIYHPNLDPPDICIDLINRWRPVSSLKDVIDGIRWLLRHPNPDDPYEGKEDVAGWYKANWDRIKKEDIVIIEEEQDEIVIEGIMEGNGTNT
ncbi:MAG: hypothetical protein A7316_09550 [Candidatus Altiarchaeales archaeon WOR_SM1_86-2]|nr:MAG: hypothetical protein A7316_09550 [Candidatus Altiarchaeales archaeon WOR_SM1_86-2]